MVRDVAHGVNDNEIVIQIRAALGPGNHMVFVIAGLDGQKSSAMCAQPLLPLQ